MMGAGVLVASGLWPTWPAPPRSGELPVMRTLLPPAADAETATEKRVESMPLRREYGMTKAGNKYSHGEEGGLEGGHSSVRNDDIETMSIRHRCPLFVVFTWAM